MKMHHVSAKIESLLTLSDDELNTMFGGSGQEVRNELIERHNNGEVLVGADGCDAFNPVTGCPGHEIESITYVRGGSNGL